MGIYLNTIYCDRAELYMIYKVIPVEDFKNIDYMAFVNDMKTRFAESYGLSPHVRLNSKQQKEFDDFIKFEIYDFENTRTFLKVMNGKKRRL